MVFSSIVFLFRFLPAALIIMYITPDRYKNIALTLLSLIFYSYGEAKYILLMAASILADFTAGLFIYKYRFDSSKVMAEIEGSSDIQSKEYKHTGNSRKGMSILCLSLIFNLGMLFIFKYLNFFIELINSIFNLKISHVDITLPLGISFYTFQTMSYSIDVYKGRIEPERNIINFAAFVTLFPQLIAGPIVKYSDIQHDLKERDIRSYKIGEGIEKFILGLGRKVLIANNIGMLWTEAVNMGFTNISTFTAYLGILSFSLQIYFDFSGYSLMAQGIGSMLGFDFPENFNYPYISKSISEFWRRWHITLGSWFKEYVYIPLGGNRRGNLITIRNLFIVWILTGLWHGAGLNFILWGFMFFCLITLEKCGFSKVLKRHRIFSHVYTLFFLLLGWVLFSIEDYGDFKLFMHRLFVYEKGTDYLYYLRNYGISLALGIFFSLPYASEHYTKALNMLKSKGKKGTVYSEIINTSVLMALFIISTAYLVDATYNPFLYFRF
ncbi:MAG: MBOAT family O-acyltransferase [Clostridium sp.]|nr:MBOAT family O-acyltransferase [Clostridium sp.]